VKEDGGDKMKGFFRFIAGPVGRLVRVIAGVALIVIGLWLVQGVVGWILAVVGLVPLLAGIFDRCVFAPLFGLPFDGFQLRRALNKGDQA
jgi:hypothetical protein